MPFLPGNDEDHLFDVGEVMSYQGQFDCVINLNWWDSPGIQAFALALHRSDIPFISLAKHHGHFPPIGARQHVADYAFQLASALDGTFRLEDFSSLQPIDIKSRARARQIRGMIPADRKVLAIHTLTRHDKRWSTEKFQILIDRFLQFNEDYIALVVDRTDADLDHGLYESRIFCLDQVDLPTTTALVAESDAFVGIDSYFLHVADFARVPSIGLFGSTSPAHWGFRFTKHRHLVGKATADIEVSAVFEAMQQVFR